MKNVSDKPSDKGYEDIYLARQPVFDKNMNRWAYELLYRDRKLAKNAVFLDELQATLKVLAGLPLCLDLTDEKKILIINFPSKAVIKQIQMIYPSQTTVVQLTGTIDQENELIEAIKKLKEQGYQFSFDNFENNPDHEVLCHFADYITIDFLGKDRDKIKFLSEQCKKRFKKSTIIAKKIEDYDDYHLAISLGFKLFQGFFFQQPKIHSGKKISTNTVSKLKILKLLQNDDVEFKEISMALATDVSIIHRLLVYINSPGLGLRNKVSSIEEALVIMGLEPLKRWLQIILLTDIKPNDKPHELVLLSAQRAYFLELLAGHHQLDNIKNQLFILGLFSLIDTILEHPKENLLSQLSLGIELENALLGKKSDFLSWLVIIESCEKADWSGLEKAAKQLGIDTNGLFTIYEMAYHHAKTFFI
jgi:EAL and modified HD-GYP domain-containing signal transduction protein